VHVGYNDAGYTQNFNDPSGRWGVPDHASGPTGSFRWSRDASYLIFPQIGLPARATIRWRVMPMPGKPLPTVRVLLNGGEQLGTFPATGEWETHVFTISSGLLKANDLYLELRTDPVTQTDDQVRGVQVDLAELATASWPILPYPSQMVLGGLAIATAILLVRRRQQRIVVALLVGLLFLLLYRLQLFYYPWLTLPLLLPVLFGVAALVKSMPRIAWPSRPWLATLLGVGGLAIWLLWLLQTARGHVVLSVPGVERDFSVFSARASALGCAGLPGPDAPCVLQADGFYQLGYPFLLWLFKAIADANAFLAARLVSALSGLLLLGATWALGWRFLGRGPALLALTILALSAFVVQYALYAGTDMPFAALWTAGLASLLAARTNRWTILASGLLCGLAFLLRHPGLILLPYGWIALAVLERIPASSMPLPTWRRVAHRVPWRLCVLFTLGWIAAALPQFVVNVADTGQPLYNQQAKNIWLAVYGNTDWSRWEEARDDISLGDVVLADPGRFAGNWWSNLQAFLATGAEDPREFGQAISLRLLDFPANLLAIAGIGIWLLRGGKRERLLLAVSAIYVLAVCVGFVLPRFFLPLAPVWALASATTVVALARWLATKLPRLRLDMPQWALLLSFALLALLVTGPQAGARYVLDHQDSNSAAVANALLPRLHPADHVFFALPSTDLLPRYSALSHYANQAGQIASYGVWSPDAGELPSELQTMKPLATFGKYQLFSRETPTP
jgi:hypothetical protein